MEPETIVALSTPPGMGAIAVVRISGPKAIERVQALCPELKQALPDRRAMLLTLSDAEGPIDEAVVTAYHAPRSYTGEDVVEISVHGSTY
ncbi:MAG: tRNA uridine-5-carboxymethylaminomethyl(34) synthesis GTPase MnmE, partial [Flavobacteriales bacterium]|nr:tRNA uridine-5-carboxymethylaminomethyl(34) synthesis GTPase MnmE [Flavobacteriales bacterium]